MSDRRPVLSVFVTVTVVFFFLSLGAALISGEGSRLILPALGAYGINVAGFCSFAWMATQ